MCLLVAAPWYIWVGVRTDGEFLRSFFFEHNLGRAMQTMEGHRGNLFFYPIAILVGFFPWSVFTVPLLVDLVRRLRSNDAGKAGSIFAICWIGVYIGIFSIVRTKLPSYVTPCYPALALLVGVFVDRIIDGTSYASRNWQYAALGVFTAVGFVFTAAIPIAAHEYFPGEEWLGIVGLIPLTAGLFCIHSLRSDRPIWLARCFAGGSALFLVALLGVAADRVGHHNQADRLWATVDAHSKNPRVAAFACLEPSWVFYGGHAIDELSHERVGPTHSPWVFRNSRWEPKGPVVFSDLVDGPRDPFIVTTGQQLERVKQLLPDDFEVLESVPLFLKEDQLVLLGRVNSPAVAKRSEILSIK